MLGRDISPVDFDLFRHGSFTVVAHSDNKGTVHLCLMKATFPGSLWNRRLLPEILDLRSDVEGAKESHDNLLGGIMTMRASLCEALGIGENDPGSCDVPKMMQTLCEKARGNQEGK